MPDGQRRAPGIPVAPSLSTTLETVSAPRPIVAPNRRIPFVSAVAIPIAAAATVAAVALQYLIALITNVAFYGRFSAVDVSPAGHGLGAWVIVVPAAGGLLVGVIARFGSAAVRGHGIPEAMEQVLHNESRIPARITLLKPASAAIAIGTGGPFGAEGPIIATGGALGSLMGQVLHVAADERKVLLAAGAAAGMTATFGTPISAVFLAVELLLFEYRARSLVPTAVAAVTAATLRAAWFGTGPMFVLGLTGVPSASAVAGCAVLGALVGLASTVITRALYRIEDGFERLPFHWMWWPAIGGLAVGLIGLVAPLTLGVGYENLQDLLSGNLPVMAVLTLVVFKLASWLIALGSGTSGGTLAPLFTIGGGLGVLVAGLPFWPAFLAIPLPLAALVGMAALFAGASQALLTSVIFAFELTHAPAVLLPLLTGCTTAYLVSLLVMRHSIMTERLARRGTPVRAGDYGVDHLEQVLVGRIATRTVVSVPAHQTVGWLRDKVARRDPPYTHHGYPVVDANGNLVGVVTASDLVGPHTDDTASIGKLIRRSPTVVFPTATARQAADHMLAESVGRLPMVEPGQPRRVIGMLTRSDLLEAHHSRLRAGRPTRADVHLPVGA